MRDAKPPLTRLPIHNRDQNSWHLVTALGFVLEIFKGVVLLLFAWRLLGVWLESVAAPVDRNNLGVMEQAVEYSAGGGDIAEQFAPFFNGTIGGHHGGAVFVATHDDLQEDFAAFWREDFQAHIINKCGAPHLLINVEFPKMWSCTLGSWNGALEARF